MEVTEDMKRMARRICVENGWPVGSIFFKEAVELVVAAIMETQRLDAELIERFHMGTFMIPPQSIPRDELVAAVRAGEHYALAGEERNG